MAQQSDVANIVDEAITRDDLKGLSLEASYAGVSSFMRRKYTKDLTGAQIAVTGVPFDLAVSNRPGTRLGARGIREASNYQPYENPYGWPFGALTDLAIVDYGDVAFDYAKIQSFPPALTDHIRGILEAGVAPVSLGGDHYVTYPILKAFAEKYGPISLLQFDAHTDTWADDDPDRIDHGTMFYKAVKEGLVDPAHSVQVGIRTTNEDTMGVHIIDAAEVHELGPVETAKRIKQILGEKPVYLTFDIDCLDPAFAPGTGTPVWGGLSSAQASRILREIAGINIKGGDVVEVSPPFDPAGITSVAGAHAAMAIICLLGWNMRA
ncbi:agmatinase [Falsiphaeobacter marinintestinus]|uniref:agmatinase n=1 Tax=Falsiphaeobacter marinintestinus TaxID=1492905 RepID=UPI0011B4CF65|nr:agmatinase [Phaeobacter marinintestinus]